jgi:hypothetical protein
MGELLPSEPLTHQVQEPGVCCVGVFVQPEIVVGVLEVVWESIPCSRPVDLPVYGSGTPPALATLWSPRTSTILSALATLAAHAPVPYCCCRVGVRCAEERIATAMGATAVGSSRVHSFENGVTHEQFGPSLGR